MNNLIIEKSQLSGSIAIPPSKSQTLRAILFASMAKGKSCIINFLDSPDTHAMIQACKYLGSRISIQGNTLEINGTGRITPQHDTIDAGNSGIVLRFISAIASLSDRPITVTGDHSICHQRPMAPLIRALRQLNVNVNALQKADYAPLTVQGPLQGGKANLNGADSQPVSALLIAAAFAQGNTEITVEQAGEIPWIDLTLSWLDRLGIAYTHQNYQRYNVIGGNTIAPFTYTVPADWSTAAFPLIAALITHSEITLDNLDFNDPQGDKELVTILKEMGANIHMKANQLKIKKGSHLKGIAVDINRTIDALPILAVLACFAEGETHIYNGAIARTKECDRISCLARELKKMGAHIQEQPDGLMISRSELTGAILESCNDHRMAMALSIAGLAAHGVTQVRNIDCISKTYGKFYNEFKKAGAKFDLMRTSMLR